MYTYLNRLTLKEKLDNAAWTYSTAGIRTIKIITWHISRLWFYVYHTFSFYTLLGFFFYNRNKVIIFFVENDVYSKKGEVSFQFWLPIYPLLKLNKN